MSQPNSLSLAEIARLWGQETGESAETIERDLCTWFAGHLARNPSQGLASRGRDGTAVSGSTGVSGERSLNRQTLAIHCNEKGQAKPEFWFAGGAKDEERELLPPAESSAAVRALHAFTSKTGPVVSPHEEAWARPMDLRFEPADPPLETGQEAPHRHAEREPSGKPSAPARTRLRALSTAGGAERKLARQAGLFVLGLALLAAGFVFGRGEMGHAGPGPQIVQNVLSAHVRSLKDELAEAENRIAILSAALETSEKNVNRGTRDPLETWHLVGTGANARRFDSALSQNPNPEPAAAELNVALERIVHLNTKLRSLNAAAETLIEDKDPAGQPRKASSRNGPVSAAALPVQLESASVGGTENTARARMPSMSEPLAAAPEPGRPLNEL